MRTGRTSQAQTYADLRLERDALVEEVQRLRRRVAVLEGLIVSYEEQAKGLPTYLRCSVCRQVKPPSEFWRDRSNKWGYRSQCKVCSRAKIGVDRSG